MGDAAGIGAEIIAASLQDPATRELSDFIIIGDAFVFKNAFILTRSNFSYKTILKQNEVEFNTEPILFLDLQNIDAKNFEYGIIKPEYGKAAVEYINAGYSLIKQKKADALVTAPINKYSAKEGGFKYGGHTEFLAYLSKAKNTAMMLTGG